MDGKDATELHELLDRVQLGIHEQGVRKPVLQDSLEREFWERHLRFCSDTDGVNDGEKLKTRHWIHDVSALHRGAAHSFSDWLNHQHTDVCNPIGEVPKRLASVRGHGLLGAAAHVLTSCFGMYRIKQASEPGRLFPSWLPYTTSDTLQQLFLPPSKETATEARSEGGCLFQIAFSAKNATLAAHATRLDASFLPVACGAPSSTNISSLELSAHPPRFFSRHPILRVQSMTLQRFRSDPTASFLHPFFNDPNASVDVRGSATDVIPLTLPHLYMYARACLLFFILGLAKSQNSTYRLIVSLLACPRFGLISSQNAMNNGVIKWFDEFLLRSVYFIAAQFSRLSLTLLGIRIDFVFRPHFRSRARALICSESAAVSESVRIIWLIISDVTPSCTSNI
jgi:hypothetical protein